MIIDCVSDLHGTYPELEGGDLLIVAGDLTANDTAAAYLQFYIWMHQQKYEHRVVIGGNHDNLIEKEPALIAFLAHTSYLCDSGAEFGGFKMWGSPWTKTFEGINLHCKAFTVDTEGELEEKFHLIPHDIDILITHSPPYDIFDKVRDRKSGKFICTGSTSLLVRTASIKPRLHVFGHIHEGYGIETIAWGGTSTTFVNASIMNMEYGAVNRPVRVIL